MATLSPVQMICHLFLENQSQAGTLTQNLAPYNGWLYHSAAGNDSRPIMTELAVLNHDKETYCTAASHVFPCTPAHICKSMLHTRTLCEWGSLVLGVGHCSITVLTACARAHPALPEQAVPPSHKPRPGHCHGCKARAKHSCCRGCRAVSGLHWQEEAAGASLSQGLQGCCAWPGNTPAVSCSSLELKQPLFTLTTALKGKIQVDFEVVEFTHQLGFLWVCGIELWASE